MKRKSRSLLIALFGETKVEYRDSLNSDFNRFAAERELTTWAKPFKPICFSYDMGTKEVTVTAVYRGLERFKIKQKLKNHEHGKYYTIRDC